MKGIAAIIIPKLGDFQHIQTYLNYCTEKVAKEYRVITPSVYSIYSDTVNMKYLENISSMTDKIFMYADLGLNDDMIEIMYKYYDKVTLESVGIEAISLFKTDIAVILDDISFRTGISVDDLKGNSRKRQIVEARHIYFKRAKKMTNNSLYMIGSLVNKDHATVLHGLKQADQVRELVELYDSFFKNK